MAVGLGITDGHLQSLIMMHAPAALPKGQSDRCRHSVTAVEEEY